MFLARLEVDSIPLRQFGELLPLMNALPTALGPAGRWATTCPTSAAARPSHLVALHRMCASPCGSKGVTPPSARTGQGVCNILRGSRSASRARSLTRTSRRVCLTGQGRRTGAGLAEGAAIMTTAENAVDVSTQGVGHPLCLVVLQVRDQGGPHDQWGHQLAWEGLNCGWDKVRTPCLLCGGKREA
jgi:hypothetical protein